MSINESNSGKIAAALMALFVIMLVPPVVNLVNSAELVAGVPLLFLWIVVWGLFMVVVFLWAAKNNAFALTEADVPPELRDREDVFVEEDDVGKPGETRVEGGEG